MKFHIKISLICALFLAGSMQTQVNHHRLLAMARSANKKSPFAHNLCVTVFPQIRVLPRDQQLGQSDTVTIYLHGFGESVKAARRHQMTHKEYVVSFNFPDATTLYPAALGTHEEIWNALYVIKQCVVDAGVKKINIFGRSAGGAVTINLLSILNSTRCDAQLKKIGIDASAKTAMIAAIQQGVIMLDVPLKALEDCKTIGSGIIAKRYRDNKIRPIDTVEKLVGMNLNMLVFIQTPDEIISNESDVLFIERLKKANATGRTVIIMGDAGGHNTFHDFIWNTYTEIRQSPTPATANT